MELVLRIKASSPNNHIHYLILGTQIHVLTQSQHFFKQNPTK